VRATLPLAEAGVAPRAQLTRLAPGDSRWTRLVDGAPEATAFHQPAWLHALTQTYGYEPLVLALVDAQGEAAAGIPVTLVRRPLSGATYVSLPFTDHCPPIARDGAALELLAAALRDWRRRPGGSGLEIRGHLPAASGLHGEVVGVRHLLPLDGASDELSKLKPAVARHVRAAMRAGVEVRVSRSWADMETFYRMHVLTRRRLGVPVQPKRFLKAVWEQVVEPGMGFLSVAEDGGGAAVATALFLAHGQALIYKYGASDASRWELKPNHLLFWRAIGWGRENGFRELDFGKSDLGSDGLRRFKSGWGAEEVPLEYMRSERSGPGAAGSERLAGALKAVISHSPALVCRATGELLYRYAG
jgi:CelD/BcsL family acetyltransferase involved in cellulose biosynthesis